MATNTTIGSATGPLTVQGNFTINAGVVLEYQVPIRIDVAGNMVLAGTVGAPGNGGSGGVGGNSGQPGAAGGNAPAVVNGVFNVQGSITLAANAAAAADGGAGGAGGLPGFGQTTGGAGGTGGAAGSLTFNTCGSFTSEASARILASGGSGGTGQSGALGGVGGAGGSVIVNAKQTIVTNAGIDALGGIGGSGGSGPGTNGAAGSIALTALGTITVGSGTLSSGANTPSVNPNQSSIAALAYCIANGACGSSANVATAFLPTANLCSAGTASSVTPGASNWGWSCTGTGPGATNATCSAPYSVVSGGGGTVGAIQTQSVYNWQIDQAASGFVALPAPAPAGITFPGGATKVVLITGTAGTSATVTLRFSSIPAGAQLYKYGKENGLGDTDKWFPFPATIDVAAGTVTYTLTDGQRGDNDWTANGVIDDPVGLGVGGLGAGIAGVPTLSQWAMLLLAFLVAMFSMLSLRRKAGPHSSFNSGM